MRVTNRVQQSTKWKFPISHTSRTRGRTERRPSHLRCCWTNDMELVPKQFAWAEQANWLFLLYTEDVSFFNSTEHIERIRGVIFCIYALYKLTFTFTLHMYCVYFIVCCHWRNKRWWFNPRHKIKALCNGDVHLFVHLFVYSSVAYWWRRRLIMSAIRATLIC